MSGGVQTGTIETKIPARLDRLPWSRFHWMVIIGLGTVWILDGWRSRSSARSPDACPNPAPGSVSLPREVSGLAASLYVAGACVGALIFGQLTDRYGRKKLFMITLGIYLVGDDAHGLLVLTAVVLRLPLCHWYGHRRGVQRDQLGDRRADPGQASRSRRHLDQRQLLGRGDRRRAAGGVRTEHQSIFAINIGWRLCFALGAVLGLGVLMIRRNVPESPRWLFIHGREDEAEEIVGDIEQRVRDETGEELDGDPTRASPCASARRSR